MAPTGKTPEHIHCTDLEPAVAAAIPEAAALAAQQNVASMAVVSAVAVPAVPDLSVVLVALEAWRASPPEKVDMSASIVADWGRVNPSQTAAPVGGAHAVQTARCQSRKMPSGPWSVLCPPSPELKVLPTEFVAELAGPVRAADSELLLWAAGSLVVACTAAVAPQRAHLFPSFLFSEAVEGGTVR